MRDLELVPFESILEELKNRYDSYVLCGEKVLDEEGSHIVFDYHGGELTALGLSDYIRTVITAKMVEESRNA